MHRETALNLPIFPMYHALFQHGLTRHQVYMGFLHPCELPHSLSELPGLGAETMIMEKQFTL